MNALNVVTIGCNDRERAEMRSEVSQLPAVLVEPFADSSSAIAGQPGLSGQRCLILFRVESAQALEALRKLSSAFVGHPIIALMNPGSDAAAMLNTLHAGACQIALAPYAGAAFRAALTAALLRFGFQGCAAKVVAVSGVSEGCGATTIAINLSYEIAVGHTTNTILAELSLRVGRLASCLDITPALTTADLFASEGRLDSSSVETALTRVVDQLRILSGPYPTINALAPVASTIHQVIESLRPLADVVVLDMAYTYDDIYFETLALADHIILVAEQTVPSLRALHLVKDALAPRGIRGVPCCVINRYEDTENDLDLDRIKELLGISQLFTVSADAVNFKAALNAGKPLRPIAPQAPALRGIEKLARAILGVPEQPRQSSKVRRWLQALGQYMGASPQRSAGGV